MPCGDGGVPHDKPVDYTKIITEHLEYVEKKLGGRASAFTYEASANIEVNISPTPITKLDVLTRKLCTKLKALTPEQEEAIIYNARDPKSRALADWWEQHKESDEKKWQTETEFHLNTLQKAKEIYKQFHVINAFIRDEDVPFHFRYKVYKEALRTISTSITAPDNFKRIMCDD